MPSFMSLAQYLPKSEGPLSKKLSPYCTCWVYLTSTEPPLNEGSVLFGLFVFVFSKVGLAFIREINLATLVRVDDRIPIPKYKI